MGKQIARKLMFAVHSLNWSVRTSSSFSQDLERLVDRLPDLPLPEAFMAIDSFRRQWELKAYSLN